MKMMTPETYTALKAELLIQGYAAEIAWAEEVGPPANATGFFLEYGWVVVNSGMKNQVAERIFNRFMEKGSLSTIRHDGKRNAIKNVLLNRDSLFQRLVEANNKLAFLESLPWIGPITKYHLARNLGLDFAKPDRHLQRFANAIGFENVQEMCEKAARETGERIGVIDVILWRALSQGWNYELDGAILDGSMIS